MCPELVADIFDTDPTTGKRETAHFRVALKPPDRYREWGAFPGSIGGDGQKLKGVDVVYDGATITFYDPESNMYAVYPATALGDTLPDDLEPDGVDFFIMSRFREAAKNGGAATFLREEALEVAGAEVPCYVLSVRRGNGEYTWWVDKKSNHIVREDREGSSMVFTTIKLGEELAAGVFQFQPPPGARKNEVDRR
jgi:outer membrane lipoprotein-sorting protein